jgi:predicted nucleotidyltransferase/predicted transcriptional regulator
MNLEECKNMYFIKNILLDPLILTNLIKITLKLSFLPKNLYITYSNNIITKMNNTKILIYLLENKEEQFTINQIAKALNINYRIAHSQTKLLEKENIIKIQKAGNSSLCSLTNHFNEKIYLAENQRRNNLIKNKDFKQIIERYTKAKQNFILLLFGSYAKNNQTKHSDIDLLAITENSRELKEITKLIPKKIHLTTVSYQEFLNMKNSKELSVGTEILKNNIILIGIEEYYRLINNDN